MDMILSEVPYRAIVFQKRRGRSTGSYAFWRSMELMYVERFFSLASSRSLPKRTSSRRPAGSGVALNVWEDPLTLVDEANRNYLENHFACVGPQRNTAEVAAYVRVLDLGQYFDEIVFPFVGYPFLTQPCKHDVLEALHMLH